MQKRWIAGLGNPGKQYERTRHNAGFLTLAKLAHMLGVDISKAKHQSLYARADVDAFQVTLILPQTFMNLSGDSLAEWKRREGLNPSGDLLVVYDDMDLPLGKLRLRKEGSGGSHNGMASLIERLATQDFHRLRLGVGKPANPEDWADFVTQPFKPDERPVAEAMFERAAQAAKAWITHDSFERLMSATNA